MIFLALFLLHLEFYALFFSPGLTLLLEKNFHILVEVPRALCPAVPSPSSASHQRLGRKMLGFNSTALGRFFWGRQCQGRIIYHKYIPLIFRETIFQLCVICYCSFYVLVPYYEFLFGRKKISLFQSDWSPTCSSCVICSIFYDFFLLKYF